MPQQEYSIVDNGNRVKKMVKDISNFQRSNSILEPSVKVSNRASEQKCLSMAINIKDSIKMANSMEKENIYGLMDLAMKDSLLMESGKDRAAGNQPKIMEISISAHTKMIKKMVMEGMSGLMAACMKEDLLTMSSIHSLI